MSDEQLADNAEVVEDDATPPNADTAQDEVVSDDDSKTKTALDAQDDGKQVIPANWPETWRKLMAGEDEKEQKRLERMKSPSDVYKSFREMEKKQSAGKAAPTLPENPSDEDIAAYRKELGIPETPDKYLDVIETGLVIGDADKPMADAFLQHMHSRNMPPDAVAAGLDWYAEQQEKLADDVREQDDQAAADAVDALRAEWGNEYRVNINSIKAFLTTLPVTEDGVSIGEQLSGGRLADGTPIMSSPDALRWFAELADKENPAGFVSPGEGGTQVESVQEEIKKIENLMRTNRREYDKDEKMQARLRKLYDAEEKLGG